mmetsp:Transcript_28842/g.61882  ORF Transcript_28842/g.61882 Transcript_28842/m.61882 type:complete len:215 (-) Transcript_28842:9-653(-)
MSTIETCFVNCFEKLSNSLHSFRRESMSFLGPIPPKSFFPSGPVWLSRKPRTKDDGEESSSSSPEQSSRSFTDRARSRSSSDFCCLSSRSCSTSSSVMTRASFWGRSLLSKKTGLTSITSPAWPVPAMWWRSLTWILGPAAPPPPPAFLFFFFFPKSRVFVAAAVVVDHERCANASVSCRVDAVNSAIVVAKSSTSVVLFGVVIVSTSSSCCRQ